MYSHILIPTLLDGSREFDEAKKVAEVLLDADGRLTVLHVIEPLPLNAAPYLPAGFEENSRSAIKAKLGALTSNIDGAQSAIEDGSAGRSIAEWSEKNGVDCIIMQSHQPAFTDIFLGSTAAWVVRHAKCAVHVLR